VSPDTSRRSPFARIAVVLATASLVAACDSATVRRPGLELDVAQYIARVKQWAPAEQEVAQAITEIFRSQFLDADLIASVSSRVMPSIDAQVEAVATYKPRTPEIGKIHQRYARAWRRLREGFLLIERGMENDDGILLAQGRQRLEVWSGEMLGVATELRELADAVGVSTTKSARRESPHPMLASRAPSASAWQGAGCPRYVVTSVA
jgi:hypothetical protein